MTIDRVSLPKDLQPHHLRNRVVVIFDVLRATTTMATALANGAVEVRAFKEVGDARAAAAAFDGPKLLAGERHGVLIDGFDLGNSPHEMTRDAVGGRTIFMSTTNGTTAIDASAGAADRYVASLVNLTDTAAHVRTLGRDVTLLSSGADGEPTGEDDHGAEQLARLLRGEAVSSSFDDRVALFETTVGGRAVAERGQAEDIDFAATLDRVGGVCRVFEGNVVRRL